MSGEDFILNLILIGESGVGKTCLARRFVDDRFDPTASTIGADFSKKQLSLDGKSVNVRIWDTAGMERYVAINEAYYQRADGVVVVFDVTNRASFEAVNGYLVKVMENSTSDACLILIGNKIDLNENRKVTREEATAYARSQNIQYYEISCKSNSEKNIDKIMTQLCRDTLEVVIRREEESDKKDLDAIKRNSLKIMQAETEKEKRKCCW